MIGIAWHNSKGLESMNTVWKERPENYNQQFDGDVMAIVKGHNYEMARLLVVLGKRHLCSKEKYPSDTIKVLSTAWKISPSKCHSACRTGIEVKGKKSYERRSQIWGQW